MKLLKISPIVMLCAATPISAQFQLPAECTAYLTVQAKDCNITHHYTCEGDPDGHQWSIHIDQRGPFFVSQIDYESRWIYSFSMSSGTSDRLVEDAKDHADFTTLLREGYDDFDFSIRENTGEILNIKGFDRLTGETVVIDDRPLFAAETEAVATNADGELEWSVRGDMFVDPNKRFFLSGAEIWTYPGEDPFTVDGSPVEFHEPGDAGFLASRPKYECGVETVSFDPSNLMNNLWSLTTPKGAQK